MFASLTRRLLGVGLLSLLAAIPWAVIELGEERTIVVQIEALRSDRGEVRGALFGSRAAWPEEGRELATCRGRIRDRRAFCVLEGVDAGTYAFAFLHDENGNGRLDRDLLGIPQEGYGFSNDAAPGLGPPSFEPASFRHDGAATQLLVHTRYGL